MRRGRAQIGFWELGTYPKPLNDIDGAAHRAMVDVEVSALALAALNQELIAKFRDMRLAGEDRRVGKSSVEPEI